MPGPAFTRLTPLVNAIAADAGTNSGDRPQTAFTSIGDIQAARRAGPPDIVWQVEGGPWEPAEQDEGETSRSCDQRRLLCTVAFLATDFDAADRLVADFGAAVSRTQTRRSVRVLKEEHARQAVAGSSRYEIRLSVEVDLSVLFETYDTDTPVNAAQTGAIVEDLS